MNIQAPILVQGFWFATVQAGRLLESAVVLYDQGHMQTAASIALLAQEELGKAKILRKFFNDVAKSATITVDQLKQACEDHERKQLHGIGSSVTLQPSRQSAVGKLIAKAASDPIHEERVNAIDELRALIPRVTKAERSRSTSNREAGLYVDLDSTGTRWRLPTDMLPEEARRRLVNVISRYQVFVGNLRLEIVREMGEPELAEALEKWNDRPATPNIALTPALALKIFSGA